MLVAPRTADFPTMNLSRRAVRPERPERHASIVLYLIFFSSTRAVAGGGSYEVKAPIIERGGCRLRGGQVRL